MKTHKNQLNDCSTLNVPPAALWSDKSKGPDTSIELAYKTQ